MGSRGCLSVFAFLLIATATPASASDAGGHSLCWRGHPFPECRSFLITEVGLFYPRSRSSIEGGRRTEAAADLGWMKNVSERDAVGGTIHGKLANDYVRAGLRARYRRWLGRSVSVELSPGIIVANQDDLRDAYLLPGLVAGATLNLGDMVGISVEAERARYSREESLGTGVIESRFSETTWRAGWKLGWVPGGGGALIFIAGGIIQLLVLSDGS